MRGSSSTFAVLVFHQETSQGASILHTVATDRDAQDNGKITYSLEDPSGFFKIDENSGWIEIESPIVGVGSSALERI